MKMLSERVKTIFRIAGALVIIVAMAVSQFHDPIIAIPKEMWTIISGIITFILMGSFPEMKVTVPVYGEIVKGTITVSLLVMVSVSIYLGIDVGREWWSLIGVAVAFQYGSVK